MTTGGVDIVAALRDLCPARPLSWHEACAVAERQAAALLDCLGVAAPPVPMSDAMRAAHLSVEFRDGWPTSGMSVYDGKTWHVVVRSSEPPERQRFTLAHEFKHVLDDEVVDQLHAHVEDGQRQSRAERLCNHFAACLLMPRPWITHDFYGDLQSVTKLAARYDVSKEAMSRRLDELGLREAS